MGSIRRDDRKDDAIPQNLGEMHIYHRATNSLALRIPFKEFFPLWIKFTPDGNRLVAIGCEGRIKWWDFVPVD